MLPPLLKEKSLTPTAFVFPHPLSGPSKACLAVEQLFVLASLQFHLVGATKQYQTIRYEYHVPRIWDTPYREGFLFLLFSSFFAEPSWGPTLPCSSYLKRQGKILSQ